MPGKPTTANPHLVTVRELLDAVLPLCCLPGPAYSRCTRRQHHEPPCAALGTDGVGAPVVITWYRPGSDAWPLDTTGPRLPAG